MKFEVKLTPDPAGGYTVQCVEIPGAISEGETVDEALDNVREAIQLVLESRREQAHRGANPSQLKTVEVDA
jgi:predicted RNase H-like HicB family nuclease